MKRLMADKNTTGAAPTASKLGLASGKCLPAVLQALSAEADFDRFAALKAAVDDEQRAELIIKREGRHHEAAAEFTPALIKGLRPKVAGCYLNWQPALSQFAGYFRKPSVAESSGGKKSDNKKKGARQTRTKMHSTARMYGGKWNQTQALNLVVSQLWSWHRKYGGVTWIRQQK